MSEPGPEPEARGGDQVSSGNDQEPQDRRHLRTGRLWLDLPTPADEEALWAVHSDPGTWTHFPSGVHTDRASAGRMIEESTRQFDRDGLGYWSVRDREDGPVIGRGGCAVPDAPEELPWWNLYYRLAVSAQGQGYATELATTAIAAARAVAPDRPVIAFLLEHNHGSRRTAERAGMQLVWTGPDLGNPDPDAVRLVFCDRSPTASTMAVMEEKFRPR